MATKTPSSIRVEYSDRMNTIKGIASYPAIFKAKAFSDGDEPKFSLFLMVPKDGPDTDQFLKDVKAMRVAATKLLYPTKRPAMFDEYGISDGDEKVTSDGEPDDGAAGHWLIKAASKTKPAVIDKQGVAIMDELEVYGGCWVRLSIRAKAYGTAAKGGVALDLLVVQKVKDGEAFSGAAKATKAAVAGMGAYQDEEAEEY